MLNLESLLKHLQLVYYYNEKDRYMYDIHFFNQLNFHD